MTVTTSTHADRHPLLLKVWSFLNQVKQLKGRAEDR
jgi:hypothetical protein